jgi:LPXTG-site transpeptidase (sortase) family protein
MPSKKTPLNFTVRLLLAALGLGLVAAGGYFLYTSLTVKKPVIQAPSAMAKASIKKKTPQQKAAYTVPPTHPRELTIKKLGVDANILPVDATNGVLDAPGSAWDVGWYDKSSLPGSGTGALLIDGHVNDALGTPGVFYSLANLEKGDEIGLERGDGQKLAYSVTSVQDVPLGKVDMTAALRSSEPGKEGLTLITCGGTYDYSKKTYDHRILVFAVRKG